MQERNQAGNRSNAEAARGKRSMQFPKLKLIILILVCAVPFFGALSMLLQGSWLPSAVYLGMSLLTFGLYWRDKRQARLDGWRTPEKVLHGAELLGGWPGALLAQQVFRHKTRKVSYQLVFWLIILLHQVVWIDRVFLGGNFLARHFY
ncbi:DUF1294 domain-containing protein [Pseudomonas sp. DSP3-2-2]|uniref:DUF1294 domain-containing protein n=1 Tax=unclassified Pseudomonas TaxID=196821 RepID=UPI003CF52DE3